MRFVKKLWRLLVTINEKLDLIMATLGVGTATPAHFASRVRDAGPGMVTVTFGWGPPIDGGPVASYSLQVLNPDGSPFAPPTTLPADATTFALTMPDNTGTFTGILAALNSAGQPCPVPATTTFVPHIEPPPLLPGTPTGFHADVTP